jgi:hypothetical protein
LGEENTQGLNKKIQHSQDEWDLVGIPLVLNVLPVGCVPLEFNFYQEEKGSTFS